MNRFGQAVLALCMGVAEIRDYYHVVDIAKYAKFLAEASK